MTFVSWVLGFVSNWGSSNYCIVGWGWEVISHREDFLVSLLMDGVGGENFLSSDRHAIISMVSYFECSSSEY